MITEPYVAVVAQMVSAAGYEFNFTVNSREIKSVGRSEKLIFISEALNLHVNGHEQAVCLNFYQK